MRPGHVVPVALADVARVAGASAPPGRVEVSGVTLDSRSVRPGDLYTALPGARAHGADYSGDAQQAGAVAVLTDEAGAHKTALPTIVVARPREVLGAVAAAIYGEPTNDLELLGVTGTNGKTTTTYLLDAVLRQLGRAGLIGTIETRIGDEVVKSVRTTPEAPDLQALFAVMRERGIRACAMEVSSHALALGRVDGSRFAVAGFTNLSQDHLDFHEDFDDYFAAKASLFRKERCGVAVVNVDDEYGRRLAGAVDVPVVTVSRRGSDADWRVVASRESGHGTTVIDIAGPLAADTPVRKGTDRRQEEGFPGVSSAQEKGFPGVSSAQEKGFPGVSDRITVEIGLPGDFNVDNALLAVAMLKQLGIPADSIRAGLAKATVPGRMELFTRADGLAVYVDYAHTPDAIGLALQAARRRTKGRVIAVVGCGGDRDMSKRPAMGAAAAHGADMVIITDDNPRSEDPAAIRAAAAKGARTAAPDKDVRDIGGRKQAIRAAIEAGDPDDTVVVLGKGHETGQEIGGVVHPFDDRETVRELLEATR